MSQPLRVTAICSGNICRSPIAEVVLRDAVERAGLGRAVVVDSAGIGGWHVGEGADPRSVAVLRRHGYDGSAHRVQQITAGWFDAGSGSGSSSSNSNNSSAPDLLLAMDATHARDLRRLAPDTEVVLMRAFDPALDPDDDLDVPDPYYGTTADFEDVLAMIEAATPGTLARIRELLAP